MSFLNKIKNIFNSESKSINTELTEDIFEDKTEEEAKSPNCANCEFSTYCKDRNYVTIHCDYVKSIQYHRNKKTILVLDDNPGIISFLIDDLKYFHDKGKLNLDEFNILEVSSADAGFIFEAIFTKGNLHIDYAIIDITLGGSLTTNEGIKKYTGVDVFEIIYKENKELKYIFYTGNNLNTYIKSNQNLVMQYNNLTNKDIKDKVLFKTSLDMDTRRKELYRMLFE